MPVQPCKKNGMMGTDGTLTKATQSDTIDDRRLELWSKLLRQIIAGFYLIVELVEGEKPPKLL